MLHPSFSTVSFYTILFCPSCLIHECGTLGDIVTGLFLPMHPYLMSLPVRYLPSPPEVLPWRKWPKSMYDCSRCFSYTSMTFHHYETASARANNFFMRMIPPNVAPSGVVRISPIRADPLIEADIGWAVF